jgi:hypothetical protein
MTLPEHATQLDDVPLGGAISEESLPKAIAGGLAAAAVSAGVWAAITIATNVQIGWMAIGVGFLCGFGVRALGKGQGVPFRVVGAACSLLGIVLGNAFTIIHVLGKEGMSIGVGDAIRGVFETAGPIDYLFYAIGIWQGWKVAVPSGE